MLTRLRGQAVAGVACPGIVTGLGLRLYAIPTKVGCSQWVKNDPFHPTKIDLAKSLKTLNLLWGKNVWQNVSMISGRKIGYARVSTDDQNLSLQVDALKAAGCEMIFSDEGISGLRHPGQREGFSKLLEEIQPGDTFVVWKLDRVGRSIDALRALVTKFQDQKIEFQSVTDAIDTSTVGGRLFFNIMSSIAEFERDLNQERTKAGLKAAKRRGKRLGRPPALTPEQITHAAREIEAERETIGGMAGILGVDRKTLRRALKSFTASNENAET